MDLNKKKTDKNYIVKKIYININGLFGDRLGHIRIFYVN